MDGKQFLRAWWVFFALGMTRPAAMPLLFSPVESEGREAGIAFSNDARHLTLGLLADEDRYYSQGLHLFWAGSPRPVSAAWAPVRKLGSALHASWVSTRLRLGQEVFTPNDVRAEPPLLADDRPFVGWLHLDWAHRFYFRAGSHAARLHLQANLGVVGPASFADETQIWFHRVRRETSDKPWLDPDPSAGWAVQYGATGFPLRAQLVANQSLALIDKRFAHKLGFDIGGEALADFGALYGHVGVALQVRAGRMTRTLYVPQPDGNGRGWETFVFARGEGKAVGWNTVLTGAYSDEVSPSRWLWQNELGLALRAPFPWPEISWTWSLWSRETQDKPVAPFQAGHTDYRPGLQSRSPWFDHGFGAMRLAWAW